MTTENKSFTPENIRDLWQTPKAIFNNLDREFNFNLDVCASIDNALVNRFYTIEDNSLEQKWYSSNWCNPPYSEIPLWVNKAIEEHKQGRTIVMLVPADTSVKWFKNAYNTCSEVRFISGRLAFINARTQLPVSGNNKGSVLLIWRAHYQGAVVTNLVERDELLQC